MKTPWLVIRSQRWPISLRFNRKLPGLLLLLGLLVLLATVISVGYGEYEISPLAVTKILLGFADVDSTDAFTIYTLRLPRILLAFLVGVGFAIAGTIIQGITQNPLAAPGIIGVNAGASLAAVILLVLVPNAPVYALPLAAFLGAFIVTILIYLLAWKDGSSSQRLILVGVGFSLIATALTNILTTFGPIELVSQALFWLTGSVYGSSWEDVFTLLPWISIFGFFSFSLASELNTLSLGDEIACSLGAHLEWHRGILVFISVALSGAAVAAAGSIGFVGLMTPHLARQLVGPRHQELLPTAALLGGLLVVLADAIGRLLFMPIELPCGVVTAAIGAPYFLYLFIQKLS